MVAILNRSTRASLVRYFGHSLPQRQIIGRKRRRLQIRVAAITICTLMSGGCATQAYNKAMGILAEVKEAKINADQCTAAIYANPRYSDFVSRTPRQITDVTLLQLSDTTLLPAAERSAFSDMWSDENQCRKPILEHVAHAVPEAVDYYIEAQESGDKAAIDLMKGTAAWGDFNQRRKAAYEAEAPKVRKAVLAMIHDLQQENDAELEHRARVAAQFGAALGAVAQYYQNEQLIRAINRPQLITVAPSRTSCYTNGANTSCVTQ